jgi:putative tryptophan/tyrosine transport system substrate-binding protein
MKRRVFIAALGSAAAIPLASRAQQPERTRRIGALMNRTADDPEASSFVGAFAQGLAELGWAIGRNVRIEYRWGANDADLDRRYAAELVALAPDVILAAGTQCVAALQRVTRTLPVVFVTVTDPVGAGLIDNLAQSGGNTTGFMNFEYRLSGKWLELLFVDMQLA